VWEIVVSSAFGSRKIAVQEIKSLERHDVKKELSDWENI